MRQQLINLTGTLRRQPRQHFFEIDIKVDRLRRLNMTIAKDCHRDVWGGDAALVESIATEAGLAGTEWQPKSYVEIGRHMNADGTVSVGAFVKRMEP